MKQNVTLVLLGILIGALLMLAVPSQAHHRYSYSNLSNRITVLENKTRHINSYGEFNPDYIDVPAICSWDDVARWDVGTGLGC